MTAIAWGYISYAVICVVTICWVGGILRKNGGSFMAGPHAAAQEYSHSLTHLLVVGFVLVGLGTTCYALKTRDIVETARAAIEMVSQKVGLVVIVVGIMHFLMLSAFSAARRNVRFEHDPEAGNHFHATEALRRRMPE